MSKLTNRNLSDVIHVAVTCGKSLTQRNSFTSSYKNLRADVQNVGHTATSNLQHERHLKETKRKRIGTGPAFGLVCFWGVFQCGTSGSKQQCASSISFQVS